MLKDDVGPKVTAAAPAVSSLAYAPPYDREYRNHRTLIVNPSADDTWIFAVGGREIMRMFIRTVGNQQLAGGVYGNFPRARDLFTYYRRVFGEPLCIPVPRGQSLTVSSLGGATANVLHFGEDLTPGSISPMEVNHYEGKHFRIPVYAYLAAAVTAAGETAVDTEVKPPYIKNYALGLPFQVGWNMRILALFLEAVGVNTFSGAANHQSTTDHVAVIKNGQRLFTHVQSGQVSGPFSSVVSIPAGQLVAPNGIPNFAQASAAGSANAVYGQGTNVYPAFQAITEEPQSVMDTPLVINGGDEVQFLHGITGDVTGGANYAGAIIAALADIQEA